MNSDLQNPRSLAALMHGFSTAKVLVLGDLMLDEYVEGRVSRISPEAPVQVVGVERTYWRMGGASNVAHSIAALGGRAVLIGVVGTDESGQQLTKLCSEAGIDTTGVVGIAGRVTTRKLRVLAQHQQMLRLDWEQTDPIETRHVAEALRTATIGREPRALIISDYAKGLVTTETVRYAIDWACERRIPVLVDPKTRDFAIYRGAAVVTPNLRELELAADRTLAGSPLAAIEDAARRVLASSGTDAMVVTMGERGMLVVPRNQRADLVEATAREVYDVTGAGDTVLAVLALGLSSGATLATAATVANAAAGVVVGKVGTAVVNQQELAKALAPARPAAKVFSREDVAHQVAWWKLQGKRVVFTNGCFDILHAGHVSLLESASSHGDVLVVGINSDASVSRLKGASRPLIAERERAALLGALSCVDGVVVFAEDTPLELIRETTPDVLVKGADYAIENVVGREVVEAAGGRVVLVPLVQDRSTSRIVERIKGAST